MKLRQVMTQPVIRIHPEETVAVAARTLARYNIGVLPVCGSDGRLQGVVTDRDLVTRCLAAGRAPQLVSVGEVMTTQIVSARPDTEASQAIELMGSRQIRRLPILENGKLCGIVSLGDLATAQETAQGAGGALTEISCGLSRRNQERWTNVHL